jgi:hypothetical protein
VVGIQAKPPTVGHDDALFWAAGLPAWMKAWTPLTPAFGIDFAGLGISSLTWPANLAPWIIGERYRRGEIDQWPGYADNPFRPR